ncbi:MAG: 3-deoxy-7-phosphoheptulonate synthase [Candidatus Margulisiibacteriota bacterium]
MKPTQNLNIMEVTPLISPAELKSALPMTEKSNQTVIESRRVIANILDGTDPRFLVITGPCSIHDPEAALDYARRLVKLHQAFSDKLYIVMRVYFEKPRTIIGWKGLINDPNLDGSCDMPKGLHIARDLLLKITEMGLPTATEVLDTISPQYLSDLVAWASIGARTTESQTHREMASGLSMPVGFKNGTDGSLDVAIAAMQSALHPHSFIGINQDGRTSVIRTKGNPQGHVILRGGKKAPNYSETSISEAVSALQKEGLNPRLLVDCSHANSNKKHENQAEVLRSVLAQVRGGNRNIMGIMLESNLVEGSQKIPDNLTELKYGVSVTDACIGWETTEKLLGELAEAL